LNISEHQPQAQCLRLFCFGGKPNQSEQAQAKGNGTEVFRRYSGEC
jgi:hypothetical protein